MPELIKRQWYKSSVGVCRDYVSVLPKHLTLRANFTAKRFDKRRTTVFKEVNVVPVSQQYAGQLQAILSVKVKHYESRQQFLTRLQRTLKEVVFKNWIPGVAHAVLHSSGYDSRMLSWTIRQLYLEHGEDWLGSVVFLCSKWEGSAFKAIMEYEGWNKGQYCVVREDVSDQEYYGWSLLDFKNAWRRANGISAIPVNLFWYPVAIAQQEGKLSEQVQVFNGNMGNTVLDCNSPQCIHDELVKFYYSVLRARPMKGQSIMPYADFEITQTVCESSIKLGKRLRPLLLEFMDTGLAQFTNLNSDGDRHRRIADWIINCMQADYNKSWYGKYVAPGKHPEHKTTEFSNFWSRWTTASLCEYLRKNGYEIKVSE